MPIPTMLLSMLIALLLAEYHSHHEPLRSRLQLPFLSVLIRAAES
jgi:hypothetical protein